jgi:polyferredoxin
MNPLRHSELWRKKNGIKIITEDRELGKIFQKQRRLKRQTSEKNRKRKELKILLYLFIYFNILLFSMRIALELNSKVELINNSNLLVPILFLFLCSSLQSLQSIRRILRSTNFR